MARSKAIFDWIMLSIDPIGYKTTYLASKDIGLSPAALEARRDKEDASLKSIERFAQQYRTMKDVYHFLTHEHAFYTAHKLVELASPAHGDEKGVSDLIKKSYGGK